MTSEQEGYLRDIRAITFKKLKFSPEDFAAAKNILMSKGLTDAECDEELDTLANYINVAIVAGVRPGIEDRFRVVCSLHGIRTQGAWQKALADLFQSFGWTCRLQRWNYGFFPAFLFIWPKTRESKIKWFRESYEEEMHDSDFRRGKDQFPSVVAHSFGTYILGYTLLRFDFIRFDKVILCGSILPRDFPWDRLIERGQVQAVRNESGNRDRWVQRVRGFVRGTGPSGSHGFLVKHSHLIEERFDYDHSEYFRRDHMESRWVPFLETNFEKIDPKTELVARPPTTPPYGAWILLPSLVFFVAIFFFGVWPLKCMTSLLAWPLVLIPSILMLLNMGIFLIYSNYRE